MLEKVVYEFESDWFHRSNENPVKTSEMETVTAYRIFVKKYNLNNSKVDTDTTFLIKQLSNQLFANYLFSINTTLESIKQINFKSFLKLFQCPTGVFKYLRWIIS